MARSRHPVGGEKSGRARAALPSVHDVLAFIRENPAAVGKREIARAFNLAPADRPALRDMLRQIERSGAVTRAANRRFTGGPALPELSVVERIGADEDGVPLARPIAWPGLDPAPLLRLAEEGGEAIPVGGRAAVRLMTLDSGEIEAHVIRRLDPGGERIVGVFERDRDGGRVVSADRRNKTEYRVLERDVTEAEPGEAVVAEVLPAARFGQPCARIIERLGLATEPGAISRLAIASFDIPTEFPAAAISEADAAAPIGLAGRTDLRDLPLVTIDGSDARDFDDAVWAEADPDPANAGGWHIVAAIADVAWYVRPGSALDREAERRGNSVYFPDRVVPMLPEALSNELCSLKPGADRACLAVHMSIDAAGRKRGHRFVRGLMRSAARLTYEEVQAICDRQRELPEGVPPQTVAALYGAFDALARARAARGALELDLREDRIVLDAQKRPVAVIPVQRLDSHRLIEEFMILANVAAAEELESRRQPCMYRVHDAPDPAKVAALRDFVEENGIPGLTFAKGQALKPELFNRLLRRAEGSPIAPLVNELVLRCQAQAAYSPGNIGHFGLSLRRYAHFTSPIRRYADLVVHRALISGANDAGNGFGAGGLPHGFDREQMAAIGEHISATERRAISAERAAMDRYRATLLADAVGSTFAGQISGVADFGLFVTLAENGADGLVPISTLPSDYYDRREKPPRLVGRRYGRVFALGSAVAVRLREVDALGGRLMFRIEEEGRPMRGARGGRRD
jgi:ribonuclease R